MTKEEFISKWFGAEEGAPAMLSDLEEVIKTPSGKVRPLLDKVMVEPIEADLMAGNLALPQSAQEKPMRGRVVAVGPGKESKTMEISVGDIVLFSKFSGTEVEIDEKTYKLMREADIFAII